MTRLLLLLLDVAWPEPPVETDGSQRIGPLDGIEEDGLWWLQAYGATDSRRQRQ